MGSEYTGCGSSGVPAWFTHFMASSVSHGAATPLFLPTFTVYLLWGTFNGVLGMCGGWSCVFWDVGAACAAGSCAGSYCSLVQSCRGGCFLPPSAIFALVLGLFLLFKEFLALALVFLGYT